MKRSVFSIIFVILAAFTLSACSTAPTQPVQAAAIPQSALTLILEVKKAELELQRTEQMAWLKYAQDSDSDIVKGFIMGRSAAVSAPASSATETVLRAQAQADSIALRREETAERNSGFNKGLALFDRGAQIFMFSKGLSFQRFQLGQQNAQERYRLDTLRSAQTDSFKLGSDAALGGLTAGGEAVLGGLNAAAAFTAPVEEATPTTPTTPTTP